MTNANGTCICFTGLVNCFVVEILLRRWSPRNCGWRCGAAVGWQDHCTTVEQGCGGATAPFQYALSTKAGCECVAHALQALSELNPKAIVLSIDGISAFDLISRRAMLTGLAGVREVHKCSHLDDHRCIGGRIPWAQCTRWHSLHCSGTVFAYLDDIYVVCLPDRVGVIFTCSDPGARWENKGVEPSGHST